MSAPGGRPACRRFVYGGLVRDGRWVLASLAAVPVIAYVAAWSGWLFTSTGYDRNWAAQHGIHTPVISALVSLFEYNRAMLHFDTTLTTHHPYESQPWSWLVISRPVSYYYAAPKLGQDGCHVQHCSQEVLAIGTPLIWWVSIAALVICLAWWLTQRDWRAGAVLVGVAAGWLPWFLFLSRTKFYFYAVVFDPFLVISITLCLGLLIGPARGSPARRAIGAARGRRVPARRAAQLLLPVPGAGRQGHPVQLLAGPDVVQQLDLIASVMRSHGTVSRSISPGSNLVSPPA